MIDLPVFDKLIVIDKNLGPFFGAPEFIKDQVEKGRSFIGTTVFFFPFLLKSIGKVYPDLNKGGMYFKGNPIPFFITPVKIGENPKIYVYEIHFL